MKTEIQLCIYTVNQNENAKKSLFILKSFPHTSNCIWLDISLTEVQYTENFTNCVNKERIIKFGHIIMFWNFCISCMPAVIR